MHEFVAFRPVWDTIPRYNISVLLIIPHASSWSLLLWFPLSYIRHTGILPIILCSQRKKECTQYTSRDSAYTYTFQKSKGSSHLPMHVRYQFSESLHIHIILTIPANFSLFAFSIIVLYFLLFTIVYKSKNAFVLLRNRLFNIHFWNSSFINFIFL